MWAMRFGESEENVYSEIKISASPVWVSIYYFELLLRAHLVVIIVIAEIIPAIFFIFGNVGLGAVIPLLCPLRFFRPIGVGVLECHRETVLKVKR
jgi:hypothetical protein